MLRQEKRTCKIRASRVMKRVGEKLESEKKNQGLCHLAVSVSVRFKETRTNDRVSERKTTKNRK